MTQHDGRSAAEAFLHGLKAADGLFVTDAEQRIVEWSDSAERMLGYRATEALGRRCYELMAGEGLDGHPVCRRDCRVVANGRRGRPTAAYDIVARSADGALQNLNVSAVLVTTGGDGDPLFLHLVRARPQTVSADSSRPTPHRPLPSARPPVRVVPALSRRELEVLRLLATGQTTVETAQTLSLSRLTVRNHLTNLQRKLGARNRVEALLFASHHRLI